MNLRLAALVVASGVFALFASLRREDTAAGDAVQARQVEDSHTTTPSPVAFIERPPSASRAPRFQGRSTARPRFSSSAIAQPPDEEDRQTAPLPYDFEKTVGGSRAKLENMFSDEAVDHAWAPKTADTFNQMLAAMPERSVIGNYGLDCRSSLCRVDIQGDSQQLLTVPPQGIDVQRALHRLVSQPGSDQMFDNYMMFVDYDPVTDRASVNLYVHRRAAREP